MVHPLTFSRLAADALLQQLGDIRQGSDAAL